MKTMITVKVKIDSDGRYRGFEVKGHALSLIHIYVIDNDGKGRAAVGLTAVYEDGTPLPEYNGE